MRSQWGRYNLPRSNECVLSEMSITFLEHIWSEKLGSPHRQGSWLHQSGNLGTDLHDICMIWLFNIDMGMSENGVYPQWNSHLVGIMISKTIGCRGTLFSDKPIYIYIDRYINMSSLPVTRTEVSNSGSGDQKLSFLGVKFYLWWGSEVVIWCKTHDWRLLTWDDNPSGNLT